MVNAQEAKRRAEEVIKNTLFNESMSSKQAEQAFWKYAAMYHEKDFENMKREYAEVLGVIIPRELRKNQGWMTEI